MTATAVDRRRFRVLLTNGKVPICSAIERADDGAITVVSTLGERFPASRILKVLS